jgi:zinc transporter ZupT
LIKEKGFMMSNRKKVIIAGAVLALSFVLVGLIGTPLGGGSDSTEAYKYPYYKKRYN